MSATVLERPSTEEPAAPPEPVPQPGHGGHDDPPDPPGGDDGGGGGGGGGSGPRQWPIPLALLVVAAIGALLTFLGVVMQILATIAGSQLLPGA